MKISKQARREAKQLFRVCQVAGALDESRVRQAVTAVIAKKPRGYAGILTQFQRLVKLDIERRSAKVESAAPLDAGQRSAIQENLSRRYGANLNLSYSENPALIGGVRVQVGSDVYDGSIRARLEALRESF